MTDVEKKKLIDAINSKGLRNSLISIWYNIGRVTPFRAQRFPDGRVSDWYRNQFVEVHSVKPGGAGGKYGNAYGFYYRNGERADAWENDKEHSWCKLEDTEPQEVPCGACGSWVLLDILGEPTTEPIKVYGLNDVLDFGKHKGKTLQEVISSDWGWIEWAADSSDRFYFDIDALIEERKKTIKKLLPDDVITFGKYKGQTIRYIFDNDKNYLRWLIENTTDFIIDLSSLVKPKEESK